MDLDTLLAAETAGPLSSASYLEASVRPPLTQERVEGHVRQPGLAKWRGGQAEGCSCGGQVVARQSLKMEMFGFFDYTFLGRTVACSRKCPVTPRPRPRRSGAGERQARPGICLMMSEVIKYSLDCIYSGIQLFIVVKFNSVGHFSHLKKIKVWWTDLHVEAKVHNLLVYILGWLYWHTYAFLPAEVARFLVVFAILF